LGFRVGGRLVGENTNKGIKMGIEGFAGEGRLVGENTNKGMN